MAHLEAAKMPRESSAYQAYVESGKYFEDLASHRITASEEEIERNVDIYYQATGEKPITGAMNYLPHQGYVVSINQNPELAAPEILGESMNKPLIQWGADRVLDFWGLLTGSAADKTEAVMGYIPVDKASRDSVINYIDAGAGEQESGWQHEPKVTIPGFEPMPWPELPDFGKIGLYAGVLAVFIGGVYLIGKFLTKRR